MSISVSVSVFVSMSVSVSVSLSLSLSLSLYVCMSVFQDLNAQMELIAEQSSRLAAKEQNIQNLKSELNHAKQSMSDLTLRSAQVSRQREREKERTNERESERERERQRER